MALHQDRLELPARAFAVLVEHVLDRLLIELAQFGGRIVEQAQAVGHHLRCASPSVASQALLVQCGTAVNQIDGAAEITVDRLSEPGQLRPALCATSGRGVAQHGTGHGQPLIPVGGIVRTDAQHPIHRGIDRLVGKEDLCCAAAQRGTTFRIACQSLGLADHHPGPAGLQLRRQQVALDFLLLLIGQTGLVGHQDAARCTDQRQSHRFLPVPVVALDRLVARQQDQCLPVTLKVAARHLQHGQHDLGHVAARGSAELLRIGGGHVAQHHVAAIVARAELAQQAMRARAATVLLDQDGQLLPPTFVGSQPLGIFPPQVIERAHQRGLACSLRAADSQKPLAADHFGKHQPAHDGKERRIDAVPVVLENECGSAQVAQRAIQGF